MQSQSPSLPYKWSAQEYEYFLKSADWFWAVSILTFAISVSSFILGNFLFGALILVSGFAIILFGVRKPQKVEFSITGRGVQIGKKLYPYEFLESFWIHYEPPLKKEISLMSKKTFMPYIRIPLGDTDPNTARELLIKFIKEKEQQEPFADTIMKSLKF